MFAFIPRTPTECSKAHGPTSVGFPLPFLRVSRTLIISLENKMSGGLYNVAKILARVTDSARRRRPDLGCRRADCEGRHRRGDHRIQAAQWAACDPVAG